MKSTKRILSAILALCMVFGCFAVGFTAQASSADLQEAIDAAIAAGTDVDWKGGNVTVEETLVINGDVEIDFNNATLTGAEGISVVNVKGGNVTLYNGTFIANSKSYSGETGFIKSLMNYRPAVSINGGNVVLDCITAVGSLIRIPNSGTIEVTTGNGINANAGNVTIRDSIAVGMKALDNTKASVVIEDALLVGIYKAINDVKKVTYEDGYDQYRSVHFLEDLLADDVTLTPGERKYFDALTNSQGDFSAGSVIASVKAPEFAALESAYEGGELTLTAKAAAADEDKAGVPNRYSYKYTPVCVTVDGEEVAYTEQADGTYTAKLAAKANTTYTATTEYKLSVKLGKQQKEVLSDALDTVAAYADKAPELLYRFVKDFEDLWQKAEEYAALVYGVLTDPIAADVDFVNTAEMKEIKALMYAVLGQNKVWNGDDLCFEYGEVVGKRYNQALSKLNGATTDEAFANAVAFADNAAAAIQADEITDDIYAGFEGFFDGKIYAYKNDLVATGADGKYTFDDVVKYMSGKGLLEEFADYYYDIKDMIYDGSTTEFADPAAAAEYVANEWENIYALVENALVIFDKVDEIVNAEDSQVRELLDKAGIGSVDTILNAFNKASTYLDKVVSRIDKDQIAEFANKYGENFGKKCADYTNKFLNIANNPSKYFEIEIDGDYVNLFKFEEVQEIVTPADKPIRVELTVGNGGSADFNGTSYSTGAVELFDYNEAISIVPTANPGYTFSRILVHTDGNTTVVDGEAYTAKAATNVKIEVIFTPVNAAVETEIVFMTDKTLGFKYLGSVAIAAADFEAYEYGQEILDNLEIPTFKNTEYVGLSEDFDSILAKLQAGEDVIFVYAQYKNIDGDTVVVPDQAEAIKMTDFSVEGGKAYFEATIQVPDGYKAIEAGIIATKNAAFATEDAMTTDLSGTSGVLFGRVDNAKDDNGYVNTNVVYTLGVKATGTVYARGYIVLVDDAGNTTIEYTEIVDVTL